MDFTGQTVLVTGANRGIGRVTAQAFASAGARVAAHQRRPGDEVVKGLPGSGHRSFAAELTDSAQCERLVADVAAHYGRIDVLVNNAGIAKDGLAVRMKQVDWEAVLSTNLSGAFYAIQQVLQGMMRERWGRIINISSVVGEMGNPGQANYVASKAGLIGLTKSLAREVGSRNITVNAVAPGFIGTDMTSELSEELKQKMIDNTPLRRMGAPEEVAAAVKFLASDDAAFITGHVLDVNGGIYM